MKTVYMYNNGLRGVLPDSIGNWENITSLQISGNAMLTGGLPSSLARWTQLEELYAYDSQLNGSLPSLGAWTQLRVLDVFGNNFSGTLPSALSNLQSLRVFNIDRNRFGGGLLPALPFGALKQCQLLNSLATSRARGAGNAFKCPWPEGATDVCKKYDGKLWVPITDLDCDSASGRAVSTSSGPVG